MEGNAEYSLYEAVKVKNEELVKNLIETGCNVNDLDSSGRTPLHYAATRRLTYTRYRKDRKRIKFDPIDEQEIQCRVRIASLLINAGADIERLSKVDEKFDFLDYSTALQESTLSQNNAMVELLLRHGADIHAKSGKLKNTALHFAMFTFKGNLNLVKTLLDQGAQVNAVNHWGETPLHLAAQYAVDSECSTELIELLFKHGTDIYAKSQGNTALHYAMIRGNINCAKILLKHGSDVNAVNEKGETPLHLIAMNLCQSSVELVELLLKHGADVSIKCQRSFTAFERYSIFDRPYALDSILLKLFLYGNRKDNRMSPLHEACMLHKAELVRDLLREGADLTAKDCFGRVPMFYAFIVSSSPTKNDDKNTTLKLLLDYGANGDQICLFPKIMFKRLNSKIRDIILDYSTKRLALHDLSVNKIVKRRENLVLRKFALLWSSKIDKISFQTAIKEYTRSDFVTGLIVATYNSGNKLIFEELRLMKKTKIGKSKISFLDVLDSNLEQMIDTATIKQLTEDFEAGKSKFKNYEGILEANFYKSYARKMLVKSAADSLSIILCNHYSLEVYFRKYLRRYSNEELTRLIE